MAEFKFPCPQCGQSIQCDVTYSGKQINCPACQQAIVVPRASANAGGMARTKSHALRNSLIAATVVIVLAGLGAGGWMFYSKHKASGGNPAARVATPTAAESVQALSILTKVHAAYTNLNTVKAEGTLTLFLNLSNLTMADVNPNMPANAKNAKRRPPGMPRTITNTTEISIKQNTQSNFYYFAGEAVSRIDRQTITNTFAFWSSDKGRFMFNDTHLPQVPATYMQLPDIKPSDNPAQQFKNVQRLFEDPANLTKIIKDLGQTEDAAVNGQDCYTLTAKLLGQKVKIWVDKSSYLIQQWQITLGGVISDADIDDAFSLVAALGNTNTPPAALEMIKAQVKKFAPTIAKIRGTITSTSESIEVNPVLVADDFNYSVPPGVRLMKMPNMAPQPRGQAP